MTPNDSHGNSTHPGQELFDAAAASDVALVAGIMIFAIAALGILPLLKA